MINDNNKRHTPVTNKVEETLIGDDAIIVNDFNDIFDAVADLNGIIPYFLI